MRRFAEELPAKHVLNVLNYIKMEQGTLFSKMFIDVDICVFNRMTTFGEIVGEHGGLFSDTLLQSETRGRTKSTISLDNIDQAIELVDFHFNKRDYNKNEREDPSNIQLTSINIDMSNESFENLFVLNIRMTGYEIVCRSPFIEEFAACFTGAPLTVKYEPGFRNYKKQRI